MLGMLSDLDYGKIDNVTNTYKQQITTLYLKKFKGFATATTTTTV